MKKLGLMLLVILIHANMVYALEKPTHRAVNVKATNVTTVDNYLKGTEIFTKGLDTRFDGKTALEWIEEGGSSEDEPYYTRSFNHYLNPITNSGYNGIFKSALEWSKDQSGVLLSSDCSWGATRGHYNLGLTSSTKTNRESSLANTFECIGRLMHLVQDMSVPAHTRDDGHILYNYENWVDNTRLKEAAVFDGFYQTPSTSPTPCRTMTRCF